MGAFFSAHLKTNMKSDKMVGRWPTKAALMAYYGRRDIAAVLYAQSRRWPILFEIFHDSHLLEWTSERNVQSTILNWLHRYTQNAKDGDALAEYPTFHIVRRENHPSAALRCDYMIDEDDEDWRKALARLGALLDAYNAFYQIKFSGNTGPHLIIPAEAWPRQFRQRPFVECFGEICTRLKSILPPFTDFPRTTTTKAWSIAFFQVPPR